MKTNSMKLYNNLGYWFLLFIPLVFIGFYPTYFAIILKPMPSIMHIHFALMSLWVIMVMVQPFLIKFKKVEWHRRVGRLSYITVPLAILSGFFIMRYAYYTEITGFKQQVLKGSLHLSNPQIIQQAGIDISITVFYLAWFIIFYSLAVINRRNTPSHARYMLAAALLLLGPSLDRIIFNLEGPKVFSIPSESFSYLIGDLIIAALLIRDYKNKRSIKVLAICLIISITGQVLYFTIPNTEIWTSITSFIMKPAP